MIRLLKAVVLRFVVKTRDIQLLALPVVSSRCKWPVFRSDAVFVTLMIAHFPSDRLLSNRASHLLTMM